MTIVEFLRARLDEDERFAKAARQDYFTIDVLGIFSSYTESAHVIRHDPARVLREVEAKRAIVEELAGYVVLNGPVPDNPDLDEPEYSYGLGRAYYDAAKRLAAVYSDHPDYDTAWAVALDN